jgi:cytoskeletal protein CcmA (bactofilin family)
MENQRGGNLNISGFGSSNGGNYDNVNISGGGNINGDIECGDFKISGMGDVKGNVTAANVKISGTASIKGNLKVSDEVSVSGASDVDGNVEGKTIRISGVSKIKGNLTCEELSISGASTINGDAVATKLKVSGTSNVKGNLRGEDIDIKGAADVGGDCECENFKAQGGFKIGGLLNAEDIDIKLYYKCTVNEIGGEKISVRKGEAFADIGRLIKNLFNFKESLIAQSIEGDDIYLENTIAKVVRGNNVTIGPDCEIDLVEYRNELKILDGGNVNKQEKVNLQENSCNNGDSDVDGCEEINKPLI